MITKAESVLCRLLVLCAVILTRSVTSDKERVDTSHSSLDKVLEDVSHAKPCDKRVSESTERKISHNERVVGIDKFVDEYSSINVCTVSSECSSYKKNMIYTNKPEESMGDIRSDLQYNCTSVWCRVSHESGLQCHFTNLYYNPLEEEFVFVMCNHSVVYGIKDVKVLQEELFLSSVDYHSAFKLSISVMPWARFSASYASNIIPGQSIIMARFKPDNILHVFHDDLMPIYFTAQEICLGKKACQSNLSVLFVDKNEHGKYWSLYKKFSEKVALIYDLNEGKKSEWLCFTSVHIGLSKMSVWYDYGFSKPQGSTGRQNFSGHLLRKFTNSILEAMNIQPKPARSQKGLLISRRFNRRIINEEEVLTAIRSSLAKVGDEQDIVVKIISEEGNSLHDMVEELIDTRVAVGVHGAALILSMFLPPGAVVIEIFPYGISPSAATVYKTLCELRGVGIVYVPWVNKDLKNSIFHYDYPAYYGGIGHLTLEEREIMIQSLQEYEITQVRCCDDPSWLFRIYQDTTVYVFKDNGEHISAPFMETLIDGLKKSLIYIQNVRSLQLPLYLYPAKVKDAKCTLERHSNYMNLIVHWKQPWNIDDIKCTDLFYELIFQLSGDTNAVRNEVFEEKFSRKLNMDVEAVDIWVTCYCSNVEGIEVYLHCT